MNKVYAHPDSKGRVIALNSDAFDFDRDGWIEIDEGEGDRYHHAQGNYLDTPLYTEQGIPRYKLVDGTLTERTAEEIQADIDAMPPPPPSEVQAMKNALKPIISDLLTDKLAEVVIRLKDFIQDWHPGKWETNQSVMHEDYPFRTIAPGHDSTDNPDWNPTDNRALFAPWHGTTEDTALPWFPPVEAESAYKAGEYMLWEDGLIHRAKRTTNFSPIEYPADWEYKAEDGNYQPFSATEEPQPDPDTDPEPTELNSNKTVKWAEWVDPNGDNTKLYGASDGVTYYGVRKISAYPSNGTKPDTPGWWVDA